MKKNGCLHCAMILVGIFVLAGLFTSKECQAYKVIKTDFGKEVKWTQGEASYLINPSAGPDGSLNAILAAMQTWTDVGTSTFVFNFSGQTTAQTKVNQMDQKNTVSFQTIGEEGVLASNYFFYSRSTGAMMESDIIINTKESWRTDGAPGGYDVQNIATHELGHSLSLDDLYNDKLDPEKTMYGYAAKGETKKSTLHQDDIDGISYIYPGSGNTSPSISSYTAYPTEGTAPLAVAFECLATDSDGIIAQYYFDFGDGTTQTLSSGSAAHTYAGVGTYSTSCVAYDNAGATASSQAIPVTVSDPLGWRQIPGQLNQIATGDLDANGLDDIAGVTSTDLIFFTTDLQNFQYIPGYLSQIATGDLNGDGFAELVGLSSDGHIYRSTNFATWNYLPGILDFIASGDLNGDGRDDLIGVVASGQIYYTLDLTNWQIMPGVLQQLACGDLNGDGRDDVVGLTSSGSIFYTMDRTNWYQLPGTLSQVTTGDLNGDGRSDLVGVAASGQIRYTLNLSSWQTIDSNFKQVACGDFSGDGIDDLAGLTGSGGIWIRAQ